MNDDLMGLYNHIIDSKGRLSIPSKFRSVLGESFNISIGFDKNLIIYTEEAWKSFQDALNNLNILNPKYRNMKRVFGAGSAKVEVDAHGRILVPEALQRHANLTKDVTIVGTGDGRIEIWDSAAYMDITMGMDMADVLSELYDSGVEIK